MHYDWFISHLKSKLFSKSNVGGIVYNYVNIHNILFFSNGFDMFTCKC